MNLRLTTCALVAVVLVTATTPATASVLTYFGLDASKSDLTNANAARANFVATLDTFVEETMESVGGQSDPTLFAGTDFEATSDFDAVVAFPPAAVSGTNAMLDKGPDSEGEAFNDWLQFAEPITAFGSYFARGGDGPANVLTLQLENTELETSKNVVVGTLGPGAPFFNIFFFGVTDTDPFDRITMLETLDNDGILLDNMIAGTVVVPEPGTFALLAAGAVLLCLGRFRRRR